MIEGYRHISVVSEETKNRIDKIRKGELYPILSSSKQENKHIGGLFPGDKVVIAGRTGTGKTAYTLDRMDDWINWTINPRWKDKVIILFDSWEMKDWRLLLRMISKKDQSTVKSLIDSQKRMDDERFKRISMIVDSFKDKPVYINNYSTNVEKWKQAKLAIQNKYPNHQIINIGDHTRLIMKDTERSEQELINNLMVSSMDIANRTEQIFVWLSQMNRNIESGSDRAKIGLSTPVASDIFGSDSVFQTADLVVALHRPGMYGIEDFNGVSTGFSKDNPDKEDYLMIECILKQRDGRLGNLFMEHQLAYNRVIDLDPNIIR